MTLRAIGSILLFVIVYLLLLILAVGLTILLGYAGLALIIAKPAFFTLMIGAGLISMGILILIFLIKFIFKKHTVDRSHLTEISAKEEPVLYEFIREIVKEVGTEFPKKIYLSSEVNASVFYNSSFWSMFFPIRKNLEIGLGLVNTVSKSEFKAIIAHEFGHFSQRSMKVGSFVYNVNKVIYNMLAENEGYESMVQRWANVSGYFAFFAQLGVKIVQGIKWVLSKIYEIVNISYMALSREMEFHADEIAANVAGSKPLVTSLLRMELADKSFQSVIGFYNEKIKDGKKTQNIFTQQGLVLNFFAKEDGLETENNFPVVNLEHLSRYNKSKLNVSNQWASHPSVEDRTTVLNRLNIIKDSTTDEQASSLFMDIDSLQQRVTSKLFATVSYEQVPADIETKDFFENFTTAYKKYTFDKRFNNYYDTKNLILPNNETASASEDHSVASSLTYFDDSAVDLIYTCNALEADLYTLRQIENKSYKIKSFDYDGIKYNAKDVSSLITYVENDLQLTQEKIKDNDEKIYNYFNSLAIRNSKKENLDEKLQDFFETEKGYQKRLQLYTNLINAAAFIQETTSFESIRSKLDILKEAEDEFKTDLNVILQSERYKAAITPEIQQDLQKYLANQAAYFIEPAYNDEAVALLFTAIHHYLHLMGEALFHAKKDALNYFIELEAMQRMVA